jgi:hypothetical protein
MKPRKRPKLGDVFQISLPDGGYAYGRVYEELGVGIYRQMSSEPANPPLGSRDFLFKVPMYRAVLTRGEVEIVANDPFLPGEDLHLPPKAIHDPISGDWRIYHRGKIRRATAAECVGLEREAVWDLPHIIDRILNGKNSKYLKSVEEI